MCEISLLNVNLGLFVLNSYVLRCELTILIGYSTLIWVKLEGLNHCTCSKSVRRIHLSKFVGVRNDCSILCYFSYRKVSYGHNTVCVTHMFLKYDISSLVVCFQFKCYAL